jgi:hypothetical protein
MGNYWEQSLRGFYSSHDSIKLTRHCLPHGTIEQTEVENIPFTRYSKSVAATFIQIAISLAYGSHGVTLNLFDHCGTPMQTDPEFGQMLRDKKPFLSGLALVAQRPGQYRGIRLLFDEMGGHQKHLRPGNEYDDLVADGELAMQMMESHGIPTTYSDSNVVVAIGQQLRSVSNKHLEEMLGDGRGILLDASAVAIIMERGMGELIGAWSVSDPLSIDELGPVPFSAEEFFNPSFNGAEGAFLTLTLPALGDRPSASIFQLIESAHPVSCMVDPDRQRHHVCSYAFENRLGGRVFAYAFELATAYGIAFHHPLRTVQLQAAVGWLSHGKTPILIRGNGVYPLGFRKDCVDETVLGLFNLSLDPWSDIEFILAEHRQPNEILSLDTVGNWRWSAAIDTVSEPGILSLRYGASVSFDQPLFLRVSWKP